MRSLSLLLVSLALSGAALTACGSDSGSSAASDGAALAPADSLVYLEATLKPDDDQQQEIDQLLAKFPGGDDAGTALERLIEDGLRDSDAPISYKDDVKPWLGDDAALFVSGRFDAEGEPEEMAALLATEDEDASLDAARKAMEGKDKDASYKDHDYVVSGNGGEGAAAGIVEGWLVIGTESGYKAAVDASEGEGLAGSDGYEQALEGASDERLGLVYFDTKAFIELAEQQSGGDMLGGFGDLFSEPYVVTFDADADGAELQASLSDSGLGGVLPFLGEGSELVADAPADSWLVHGQPELGKTLETYVDLIAQQFGGRQQLEQQLSTVTGLKLDELLSWMGDFVVFVGGESVSELEGALVIQTTDEAASKRTISALQRLARRASGTQVRPLAVEGEGFTLVNRGVPQPLHLFQREGKLVVAYGDAAARDAIESTDRLGDSSEFKGASAALGDDYQPSTWLAFAPLLQLVESTPASGDQNWLTIKPYLEPLGALIAGTKSDGDRLSTAVRITVP